MATRGKSNDVSWIAYIISMLVIGLILGGLARLALPGRDPMSIPQTILVGIAGAFVGGLVATALGWSEITRDLTARSVALATAGAVVVLLLGRLLLGRMRRRSAPRRG